MMRQRGMIPLGLILYAVAAVAIAGALYGVWHTWTTGKAAKVEVKAALAELACDKPLLQCIMEHKARLADCETKYKQSLALIDTQNDAVKRLQSVARNAQKRAQEALAQADQGVVASQSERARLQALRDAGEPSCIAAVAQVRSGLRP